eukprot:TRINITY_DN1519_c0_g3_i1.p1 TRINITY_DN1519_c0_g3~~TRINITY_DN1519_c0_g3_i1.p1  ORF type:complete len:142 (-),score=1.75 TRINITY_DN1519_c0_g3_i1:151-576(-)
MGLFDKLWDDTVAGPRPESGLGKLRKFDTFSSSAPRSSPVNEDVPVSRSITIIKRSDFRSILGNPGSGPSSPSSSDPESPLTPTPQGETKRFRRKSTSDLCERAQRRSPTVYDWEANGLATRAADHDPTLQFTLLNPYKGL